jgi:leader peptidase (prepilin peptidase)/N-methyltransferase
MGVLFWLVFRSLGITWFTLEAFVFVFGLVVVTFIDIDHMILPDKFTLSGIVLGLLGGILNPDRSFWDALAGVLFGGGFLWAMAYLYFTWRKQEGMGGGDIKLLAWIGAVLGWKSIPFVIMTASIVGTIGGLLAILKSSDEGLKKAIPFGPYLAGAAVLYMLASGPFWSDLYLSLWGFEP